MRASWLCSGKSNARCSSAAPAKAVSAGRLHTTAPQPAARPTARNCCRWQRPVATRPSNRARETRSRGSIPSTQIDTPTIRYSDRSGMNAPSTAAPVTRGRVGSAKGRERQRSDAPACSSAPFPRTTCPVCRLDIGRKAGNGQGDHDTGRGVECRQVDGRGRAGPGLPGARPVGGPVQAAEHVEQCRRDRRRRRDRPRAGAAGARGGARSGGRHEPGAAEAGNRHRRAGDRAGSALCHAQGARLWANEGAVDGAGAGQFSPARRHRRSGAGRGRRQPGGDQPARGRHRQHGFCRGGGCAGGAGRRHRPGRRDRAAGGHTCRAARCRPRPASAAF